jgi:spore coat polysaccharide biosynthesis predicted glycosyltransferase SpsG
MGGEDPKNVTLKLISIVNKLISNLKLIIILGHSHPDKKSVINYCKKNLINSRIIISPEDISIYLKKLRFVISAGGLSVYEFASARIPQLVTVFEKHQFKIAKMIKKNNCGMILDFTKKLNKNKISTKFINLYNDTKLLTKMNNYSKKLIRNSGCMRLANDILKKSSNGY